jgi:hypothetical protein
MVILLAWKCCGQDPLSRSFDNSALGFVQAVLFCKTRVEFNIHVDMYMLDTSKRLHVSERGSLNYIPTYLAQPFILSFAPPSSTSVSRRKYTQNHPIEFRTGLVSQD